VSRTVLVTGAARGIGAAIADAFREAGDDVLAPPRSELDLADGDAVQAWAEAHAGDGIDVLVNNAGINPVSPLAELSPADWRRTLEVNLTAPFLLTRSLGAAMAERGWGRIVNIGSAYSLVSRAGRGAYTAAKHGLAGLTKTAAIELAEGGVLVNAVCPGFVGTDLTYQNNDEATIARLVSQIPVGRLAEPAEVAGLVGWLGSDHNRYVTGQVIAVDGGLLAT
jgi:3-oxoacyl-[acyl-carrier protein] reductase